MEPSTPGPSGLPRLGLTLPGPPDAAVSPSESRSALVSDRARREHACEAMALEGREVRGPALPLLHLDAPESPEEGQSLVLVVERGEGGDEDAAALDHTRGGTSQHGREGAGTVADEGDVEGHGREA